MIIAKIALVVIILFVVLIILFPAPKPKKGDMPGQRARIKHKERY